MDVSYPTRTEGIKSVALVLYRHLTTTFTSVKLAPICILVLKVELLPRAHYLFFSLSVFQQQGGGVANHCHKAVSTALLQMT